MFMTDNNMEVNMNAQFMISYGKTTKNICACTTVAILLIFLFVLSPLKNLLLTSLFAKMAILILLAYAMYANIESARFIKKEFNVDFSNSDWNQLKMNIVCSYVFSGLLLLLLISVVKHVF